MAENSAHDVNEMIGAALRAAGVVDVHEHLFSARQRQQRAPGLFDWIGSSYLWADLVSAGMERGLLGRGDLSRDQKWEALQPYLAAVRHTGYMEVCRYAWRDLCDMNARHLDESNWRDVDAAIRGHNECASFKEDVLVRRCGMAHVLVDYQVGGTAVYFFAQRDELDWYQYLLRIRPSLSDRFIAERTIVRDMDLPCQRRVVKIDSLLYGWLPQANDENQRLLGAETARARTLERYAALVESVVGRCAESGAVGLKSAHNCCRSPELGPVNHELTQETLHLPAASLSRDHIVAFENFVFQEVVRQAGRHALPLQIHTGTTYGPSGLSSAHAGGAHRFADLIQQNPATAFVLMHGSWPNWGEVEQMAKRYPNVVLDLSWSVMLAPAEAIRMLESMVTSVPLTKLLWGGDCCYVEESYGAYVQFRRVLGSALARLVSSDTLSPEEAAHAAVRILGRNARRIYGLEPRDGIAARIPRSSTAQGAAHGSP
jgi:hypothetical protein